MRAIDDNGLDEEIRCEMCKNPMHTDRGCDGNCKYDEILYEKIIQILNKRITPLPSAQPEIIYCKKCKHWTETCGDKQWGLGDCDVFDKHLVMCDGYCAWAERREE